MQLSAAEIANLTGGTVVHGDPNVIATSFAFDSRAMAPRACFVALQGSRDGHDFVSSAFEHGATVALVSRAVGAERAVHVLVQVDDPQRALGRIAHAVRRQRQDLQVVGITGSSGKTSTKDLLRAALSTTGAAVANRDSFNNEVGLPLTLLDIDPTTRYVITEMGARFPGNIRELCDIALPTVGVITNVGLAHAEHLGGPEGIAQVKGELLEALPANGLAVLNADAASTASLARRAACDIRTVGAGANADARITDIALDDDLRARCRVDGLAIDVPLRGAHQIHNAAMAVTVARHLGIAPADIVSGLAAAEGSRWRMELDRAPNGVVVLNDAYNANPASMDAALRALADLPADGRRVAVLGEMRELGAHALDSHRDVGVLASTLHIDLLIGVGEWGSVIAGAASGVETIAVDDARSALSVLQRELRPGDVVLVKASRAVGLEQVAAALLAPPASNAQSSVAGSGCR